MDEETNSLLTRIKERAQKVSQDYQNPDGNGIDQEEANGLATMILELDRKLTTGMYSLPDDWNKSNFELGFDQD